jgi:hypothetical protein
MHVIECKLYCVFEIDGRDLLPIPPFLRILILTQTKREMPDAAGVFRLERSIPTARSQFGVFDHGDKAQEINGPFSAASGIVSTSPRFKVGSRTGSAGTVEFDKP